MKNRFENYEFHYTWKCRCGWTNVRSCKKDIDEMRKGKHKVQTLPCVCGRRKRLDSQNTEYWLTRDDAIAIAHQRNATIISGELGEYDSDDLPGDKAEYYCE